MAYVDSRLAELIDRHRLPNGAAAQLAALLGALRSEPDPHTTVSDPSEAVDIHVADSLVGLELPEIRGASTIVDVGAGAGFPGLPLAVALPRARVDLVESAGRKCAVIERLARAAGIENARAVPVRAEEWATGEGRGSNDVVTVRAVAALPVLLEYAAPLLRVEGALVAWKGARDAGEERAADAAAAQLGLAAAGCHAVTPFPRARARHLYVYRKVRETPGRYPRRPGMAAKRPLARAQKDQQSRTSAAEH